MPFHRPINHSLLESGHLVGQSKARYYFVYEDDGTRYWYSDFLKPGFKHVTAVKYNGLFWLKMDLSLGWTEFDVLPFDQYDTIHDVLKDVDYTHLQYVEAWRKPRYRVRSLFAPWTCVEAMKSLLGIRACLVTTPYQLYKHMEKHNGQNIRRLKT